MRHHFRWPSARRLGVALPAVLLLAACGDGDPEPAETLRTEDSVRAAAAAVWPADTAGTPEAGQVGLTRTNLVAVLDMSNSMLSDDCAGDYHNRSVAARAALRAWLDSVPADANLALVVFDAGGTSVRVPLGVGNRDVFVDAVNRAQPGGVTPLSEAVALGQTMLEAQAAHQRGYGEYRIVVITDGRHSDGYDPAATINDIFDNFANPIEIHTIGFCITASALNQPGVTYYRSANNPDDLRLGLESALPEAIAFDITQFADDGQGDGQ